METSRVALIALVCVVFSSQKRFSGAEVELRVRRGDDVTLSCDCVLKSGLNTVWFRNFVDENQSRFMISARDIINNTFPRYSFVRNSVTKSHDLLIKNVTESDVGLYHCSLQKKEISSPSVDVHQCGSRTSQLDLLEEASPCVTVSPNLCVSERSVSWTLVLGVCVACVLVSSLVSSVCVYRLCTNTTKEVKADRGGSNIRDAQQSDEVGDDEVCYASLDIKNLKKKKKTREKKLRVQHSDFSTYSEVRTERM